ncbi:hypothetical protein FJT64_007422 [Amphibalanus amphitrite]|uniref:C2H2-type domain-containing protein n=1 Tax=Amphibalanus amphitrite TaxID=1232801 RepID=A0A6A4VLN0_AMPAM|nr:hypothetical protein FJT64_007422 [Amphibalanus amphitrite]
MSSLCSVLVGSIANLRQTPHGTRPLLTPARDNNTCSVGGDHKATPRSDVSVIVGPRWTSIVPCDEQQPAVHLSSSHRRQMPAQSSAAGAPPPPVPPRHGPPRDVDGLIRELQRINLSQCMDQLTADIQQLSSMERQLGQWRGLYVRCPGPEPDDLAAEPGDKKSSSGYSTESGSPPASRNTSGEGIDGHGGDSYDVATSADQALCGQRDLDPRQRSVPRWRRQAGPDSPVGPRRVGLLQGSVAHSSQSRPVTPLLSRAPFCPPAASTPTLSPKVPRSPKTLRFAASHELIPPDSPSRRQVSGGAPPRPGILRSRASSVERPEALSRPAPPGWRAGSSSSSPSPGRGRRAGDSAQEATDSAERFSRVVSALSRLEAELSGVQRRLPPPRAACGTAQFVRLPPRRQLSFTALPPPPRHPPLLTGSATDSDDSDSEFESDSRWLVGAASAARPPPAPPSEDDFEVSRGARLPPPYPAAQPPRRRRPSLSWLLSCGSRRRPPSPPSTLLPAPPSEPPVTSAGAAYGCNLCKARFAEHFQLVSHVHERHVRVQMRPKYSCGLCPARFYASKFLARHCAYNHNSMGDARTPQCLKAESTS